MSEIFEGIVCIGSAAEVRTVCNGVQHHLATNVRQLEDDLTIVCHNSLEFSDEIIDLGAEISKELGRALVVRYDDRGDVVSSQLFSEGHLEREFGEEDEEWVQVDRQGVPVAGGSPVSVGEIDPDKAYSVTRNAIAIGLEALGRGNWQEIYQAFMSNRW
jgi:hypothetical protein